MFDKLAKLRPTVKYSFWAGIGHEGQTLDDLISALTKAGNTIMEIDVTNQRVLVAVWNEMQDRWGCRFCLSNADITICDSEEELLAHCEAVHPDWRSQ